ncbi:hypothetical protein GCM10010441_43500 [Kitasatospora paracochleata]|uniref:Uncharacterized protein n=1 Tax=Kitasatospora paracochleata TaxID=58354 RepID=A0ABT1ITH2_9ACTN|nr:hypothetical protein [Kitasatospora paracochleata]MCP2308233.1 hypothetical protein [Kitasatospora paracochleata]
MRTFLKGLGALLLLVALLLGAVEVVGLAARQLGRQIFHGVNPTVSAAAVTAMATVIIAVATLVIGRFIEKRKAIETEIRASKIPVYSRLVSGLFTLLHAEAGPQQAAAAETLFREITPDLITWSSDEVLVEWSRFKRTVSNLPPEEAVFALEKVLMAIRRDFGHNGSKVEDGDLLGLFVNDIDTYITNRQATHGRVANRRPAP